MKKIGLILSVFLFAISGYANGVITGIVTEEMDGKLEPVPFASVFIVGTTTGGMTDFDGRYQFSAPAGSYLMAVSFTGYEVDTVDIVIEDGQTYQMSFKLRQKSFNLKAVQVIAKANRESEVVLLMDRKNATALEERIGAQELSKKGASDVQSGLVKMSGVSQGGAGTIFVRGLGDRYNNAYLNGIPLPSPDPDKKVIPLDIIPTSVVQSLTVAKTFTPDQLGDVSGASINIVTKDYPEQKTFNVYGGLGANTMTTGKTALGYQGGKLDYFGFDDGTRSIPNSLHAKFHQLENPSKDLYNSNDPNKNPDYPGIPFAKNLNPQTFKAPANSKFGFDMGNFYGNDDKSSGFGYLVLGSFANETQNIDGIHRVVNAQDAKIIDYTYQSSTQNTRTSALGSLYYRFNPKNNIKFNTLFVNISDDQVRETDGYHWDYDNLGDIFSRRFTWTQNKLWSNQLLGTHKLLNDKLSLNWNAAYQTTASNEPDRRQLIWTHQPGDERKDYQLFTDNIADQHRYFMYLDETEINGAINGKYILKTDSLGQAKMTLSGGYQARIKNRRQDFKFYSYNLKNMNPSNGFESVDADNPDDFINDANHGNGYFSQREESRPESANTGSLQLHSTYGSIDYHMNEHWYVMTGARLEKSYQEIRYRKQSSPLDPAFVESQVIDTLSFLPMASITYSPNKKTSLRFVASQTITRPNFKELAPFQYREFFGGQVQQGNPLLQNSSNTNLDFRMEHYPNSGDLYAITVFGRMIDRPIEQVTLGAASGILLTYQNAKSAQAYGLEVEYIKKFRHLVGNDSPLRNLALGVNASYIYSQVDIDMNQGVIVNNASRPLQGASPFLANADISYEKRFSDKLKTSATISTNYNSRRLYSVGRQNIGDAYEMPITTLNFTLRNDIGRHWQLNISAGNLLNPHIQIAQESRQGNEPTIINSYQRGMQIGATAVYKIFPK